MTALSRQTFAVLIAGAMIVNFAAPAQAGLVVKSPAETVNGVVAELAKGNPKAVWDAMPAQYQKDVADIIHLAAGKVDPGVMTKMQGLMGKTTNLLKTKKAFILNSPMLADAGPELAELEKNWDGIVGLAQTLVDSDAMKIEKLKVIDPGAFLGTTGKQIMTQIQVLAKASGEDLFAKIAQAKATDKGNAENGNAIVTMSHPEERDEDVEFTKVDGKWVPADMAKDWDAQIAQAKAEIANINPEQQQQQNMQAIMMMTMVETVVDQLAVAKTQAEFDATLNALLGGFGLGAPQGGGEPEAF